MSIYLELASNEKREHEVIEIYIGLNKSPLEKELDLKTKTKKKKKDNRRDKVDRVMSNMTKCNFVNF